MTEYKPPGLSWESWTERQIAEGRLAGLFDGLDGEGKPIAGLDDPHDEEWWIKAKLRREEIDHLPPTIAIRRDRETAVEAALDARDDAEARRLIEELNERIRYVNSHAVSGPPSTVWVVDVESILDRRRRERPDEPPDVQSSDGPALVADPAVAHTRRRFRWPSGRRA